MRNIEATALVAVLRANPRAFTRHALEHRWGPDALRAAVRGGEVMRILPGIYVASEHAESLYTRCDAATTWVGSESVVVGSAAAAAWGLCDPPQVVTVTAPRSMSRHVPRWLRLQRPSTRPPSALWHECPVATPEWAIVTGYGRMPRDAGDEMVYRAGRQGLATARAIAAVASTLPRVRGRDALDVTLAAAAAGSESFLETHGLRSVFAPRSFDRFIRQHSIVADGARYRLDMYDPGTRTAVELDGDSAHGGVDQRKRDVRRDARLAASGILTLRFTYRDLTQNPGWCRSVVTRTVELREGAGAGVSAD